MTINVSEQQFKNAAKRLRNLTTDNLNHSQSLQLLSQALFAKPFEEIKATFFNQQKNTTRNNVSLLHYGSECILTLNGNYISQLCIGTEMEIPFHTLKTEAENLAVAHNTVINEVYLPEILNDEWETEQVLQLAEMMGYFKSHETIFDAIEDYDRIIINGLLSTYKLDGDWIDEMKLNEDDFNDRIDTIIWSTELYDIDGAKYEPSFSFKDLCNARKTNDNTWIIEFSDEISNYQCVIEFYGNYF